MAAPRPGACGYDEIPSCMQQVCPKYQNFHCFHCNHIGHQARNCPDSDGRQCYECDEDGHIIPRCCQAKNQQLASIDNSQHLSPMASSWKQLKLSSVLVDYCGAMIQQPTAYGWIVVKKSESASVDYSGHAIKHDVLSDDFLWPSMSNYKIIKQHLIS